MFRVNCNLGCSSRTWPSLSSDLNITRKDSGPYLILSRTTSKRIHFFMNLSINSGGKKLSFIVQQHGKLVDKKGTKSLWRRNGNNWSMNCILYLSFYSIFTLLKRLVNFIYQFQVLSSYLALRMNQWKNVCLAKYNSQRIEMYEYLMLGIPSNKYQDTLHSF